MLTWLEDIRIPAVVGQVVFHVVVAVLVAVGSGCVVVEVTVDVEHVEVEGVGPSVRGDGFTSAGRDCR